MKLKKTLSLLSITLATGLIALSAQESQQFTTYLAKSSSNSKHNGTNLSTGVQVSTVGLGVTAELPLTKHLAIRGGVNRLTFTLNRDLSDTDYELEIDSISAGLFIDLHPFNNNFRLSAGAFFHATDIDGTADLRNGIRLGGSHYDNEEVSTVTADLEYPSILPYVGIGWGSSWGDSKEWGISLDVGVAVISDPNLSLSATGSVTSDSQFDSVLESERRDAEDDISEIPVYPVIALGLSYRF